MRRKQPFLKRATDQELEGMFLRMSPAERAKYTSEEQVPETKKKKRISEGSKSSSSHHAATSSVPEKKAKKDKKKKRDLSLDKFIDDRIIEDEDYYSSDDVSLESESLDDIRDNDFSEDLHHDKKKQKKEKKKKKSSSESILDTPSKVKLFKWS